MVAGDGGISGAGGAVRRDSVGQNQLAQMAARFGDYMVTDETMTQIGDHWDRRHMGNEGIF